jgi:hypothetical protein
MDQARTRKHDTDLSNLAGAEDAGIGTVILIDDYEDCPAAGYGVLAAGGRRGEEDEQA